MSRDTRIVLRLAGEEGWRRPEVGSYLERAWATGSAGRHADAASGVGPAVTVDELYLPEAGSADVVVIAPSGAITLVECKLGANSEVRRAVVGQILSHAAGLWQLGYEHFDERIDVTGHVPPADALHRVVGEPSAVAGPRPGRFERGTRGPRKVGC